MQQDLRDLLEAQYREDIEMQRANDEDVQRARRSGDQVEVLQKSLHLRLPDTCWALEKWDEARRWYRLNAQVWVDQRAFYASDPTYPHDEALDWEAEALVKAGDLSRGLDFIRRAVQHLEGDESAGIIRSRLALFATQTGDSSFESLIGEVVEAREWFATGKSGSARKARESLHYEFAQAALMQSRWADFERHVSVLSEGRNLVAAADDMAYEPALQAALVAAAEGLEVLAKLRSNPTHARELADRGKARFEDAMLEFIDILGAADHHTYFMRLNTRLIDDLLNGREMNFNPYAPWSVGDSEVS